MTPGQDHETTAFFDVLEDADVHLFDEDGNAIPWPVALAGDKGYRADWIDDCLLEMGIDPVIPSRTNEPDRMKSLPLDREKYRSRNIVERLIGWLKESRRVMTRFEKTAINFLGMIQLACIRRMLKILTA